MSKFNKVMLAASAAALIFTFSADGAAKDFATVDTGDDPLVTLSYVNDVLKPQIIEEVLSIYSDLTGAEASPSESGAEYQVVRLSKGQALLALSPLEVVLRSGEGRAAVYLQENLSNNVGLSDLTAGAEIVDGQQVPCNHYIIVPRADGRGIIITSQIAYLMVRGEYEIVIQ